MSANEKDSTRGLRFSMDAESSSSSYEDDVVRISHLYECELCGEPAIDHVYATEPQYLTTVGSPDGTPRPYLHRMCDGRVVKL